ncbi:MAG: dihydropteroate synthase [Nitrososphaerota archaeon]|jgi:dihydropteroate synthase|nr:dihydropteroate synthase [Nitrososphaerota archaeon]
MIEGEVGGIAMGDSYPVRIIGAINLSRESFYEGSVAKGLDEVLERARRFISEGADVIDIGGMSTAPYKETWITEEAEINRLLPVVGELARAVKAPISVDTYRPAVAEKVLSAGAMIINDVSGLGVHPSLAKVVSDHGASIITCARVPESSGPVQIGDPVGLLNRSIERTIRILVKENVNKRKVAIDPCIGFSSLRPSDEPHASGGIYRQGSTSWPFWKWDSYIVGNLWKFRRSGLPIVVGVSRKSFIRRICEVDDPERVVFGSVAAEAIAVMNGAHAIRTHNPFESRQAIRIAESIKKEVHQGAKPRSRPALEKRS